MLRQAREAKGLTIEQLAAATRINGAFIKALEAGRRDQLPGEVYLKPFTKACAEALELDVKELYRLIDGQTDAQVDDGQAKAPSGKAKIDYRIIAVVVTALIIIGIIYLTVSSQENRRPDSEISIIVPAENKSVNLLKKRQRPWERPSAIEMTRYSGNLLLVVSDMVNACILADGDTVFNSYMAAGEIKKFRAADSFLLTLDKNDCIQAFYNGRKIDQIGAGNKGLIGFQVVVGKE